MDIKLEWRKDPRMFHDNGTACFLGKWIIANVCWISGTRDDPNPLNYGAYCKLPGIKQVLGKFKTEDEGKAKVEQAVRLWLKETKLNTQMDLKTEAWLATKERRKWNADGTEQLNETYVERKLIETEDVAKFYAGSSMGFTVVPLIKGLGGL